MMSVREQYQLAFRCYRVLGRIEEWGDLDMEFSYSSNRFVVSYAASRWLVGLHWSWSVLLYALPYDVSFAAHCSYDDSFSRDSYARRSGYYLHYYDVIPF